MAVKWGVIGCGGIALRRTIPEGIIPASNAELGAVMDIDGSTAKKVGDEFSVRAYDNEDDLLKDEGIDAVYLATPAYLHAGQAVKAAESGKHVLCEKPLALTVEDCSRMIKACAGAGVRLGTGFMMRFHAYHGKLKEMVKEGRLGKITFARAQLSCWYPPMEGAWRQDPELGGGGSLVDMGNHCIDVLEYILDSRVSEVSCFSGTLVHGYPVEDTAAVVLRFGNGAVGVVDSCFSIPDNSSKNRLEIYGSGGSVLAEGTIGQAPDGVMTAYLEESKGYDAEQARDVSGGGLKISPEPVNTYKAEIEEFSGCVLEGKSPVAGGEEGLWSQKVMLACYESSGTGRAVSLK